MEPNDKNILVKVIADCAKADGWSNLAEVGVLLRNEDIKYGKLSKFISNYSDIIETKVDDTRQPPVVYARLIEK